MRRDTAELASYALSHRNLGQSPPLLQRPLRDVPDHSLVIEEDPHPSGLAPGLAPGAVAVAVTAPTSLPVAAAAAATASTTEGGPSLLSSLLRRTSEVEHARDDAEQQPSLDYDNRSPFSATMHHYQSPHPTELSPLLGSLPLFGRSVSYSGSGSGSGSGPGSHPVDEENQKPGSGPRSWTNALVMRPDGRLTNILNPKRWDRNLVLQNAVLTPVACLPAVAVGLLLNILDALSYGLGFSIFPSSL